MKNFVKFVRRIIAFAMVITLIGSNVEWHGFTNMIHAKANTGNTSENGTTDGNDLVALAGLDAVDVGGIINNGVYYYGEEYSIHPTGYVRYKFDEGDATELPLNHGLDATPKNVYFIDGSDTLTEAYSMAIDNVPPVFTSENIVSEADGVTINGVSDAGVGNVSIYYSPVGENEENLVIGNEVTFSESHGETRYVFWAVDGLGNRTENISVTVEALDTISPVIRNVTVFENIIEPAGSLYANGAVTIRAEIVDEGEYAQGIDTNEIKLYKVEDDTLLAQFSKEDGSDNIYIASVSEEIISSNNGKDVKILAKDNAGNTVEYSFGIVYDNVAPTHTSVMKVNGTETDASTVLGAAAFDSGVSVEITVTEAVAFDRCTYRLSETAEEQSVDTLTDGKIVIPISKPDSGSNMNITYYVFDMAGNRSSEGSITLNYDVSGPQITVSGGKTQTEMSDVSSDTDALYTNSTYYIGVNATDDSGVQTLTVVRTDGDAEVDVTLNNNMFTFTPANENEAEKAEYRITATDNKNNETTRTLTLYYDTAAPTGSAQWQCDGVEVTDWTNSRGVMKIAITATDDNTSGIMSDIDKAVIQTTALQEGITVSMTKQTDGSYTGEYIMNVTGDVDETYTVTIYDKAGNFVTDTVNVKIDITAPQVSVEVSEDWSNVPVTITPDITENSSGAAKLFYRLYRTSDNGGETTGEKDLSTEEGSIVVDTEGQWTLELWATDNAGNESQHIEQTIRIDKSAPNITRDKVFATFEEVVYETVADKIAGIFGKKNVKVTLYVQDNCSSENVKKYTDYSQVSTVKVSYNGKTYNAVSNENMVALVNQDGNYSEGNNINDANVSDIYQIFELTLEGDINSITSSTMSITSVSDYAGNEFTGSIFPMVLNEDSEEEILVIIDKEIPVLTDVLYGTATLKEETYYVNNTTTVSVSIQEHFFTKSETPIVKLYSKVIGDADAFTETEPTLEWTLKEGDVYTADISLSETENKETEYYFTLYFADKAGNKLSGGENYTVEEGLFTSKTIVVDKKKTVLKDFNIEAVNGQTMTVVDNRYYVINEPETGIKVSVTIEDTYFEVGNLKIDVYKDNQFEKKQALLQGNVKSENGTETVQFQYDVADNACGSYHFVLTYYDNAGNPMELAEDATFVQEGITKGTYDNGCYTMSNQVVLDKVAPVLGKMTFTNPYQYMDGLTTVEAITNSETKLYYNDDIAVNFEIVETYYNREDVVVNVYEKNSSDAFVLSEMQATGNDNLFNLLLSKDGEYYFTVSYADYARNDMVSGTGEENGLYDGAVVEGIYTSPVFVLDTKAPVVKMEYIGTMAASYNNTDYYQENYVAKLTIEEENFRVDELKEWIHSGGVEGNGIVVRQWKYNTAGEKTYSAFNTIDLIKNIQDYNPNRSADGKYVLEIPASQEGNYEISVTYVDLAGNKTVVETTQTVLDKTKPVMEATYKVENGGFLDFIKYGEVGYLFGNKKLTVSVNVTDEISGARKSTYTLYKQNSNGEYVKDSEANVEAETQKYQYNFVKTIPVKDSEKDFKGMFEVVVSDSAQNTDSFSRDYIAQSQSNHDNNSSTEVVINTTPSRVVDGMKYYNAGVSSVNFSVTSTEKYSGIKYVEVNPIVGTFSMGTDAMPKIAANQSMDKSYKWNVKNRTNGVDGSDENKQGLSGGQTTEKELKDKYGNGSKQSIVTYFTHTGSFPVNESNNKDDIAVQLKTISNTNYENVVTSEAFCIDTVEPVIHVSYSNTSPENGQYYKEPLTATVTITERNFSSDDIVWKITNSEGKMPAISNFTNDNVRGDDGTQHVGTVTFSEDGDYTFEFTFQDKAGNEASYTTEPFTIDVTMPEILVSYNNNNGIDNYYNESRVATVQITEHNFKEEDVVVNLAAKNDGVDIPAPVISRFSTNGDVHTAIINYDYDAEFTFSIAYTDMAGNEAEPYEEERFVVDLTDPEILIENIEEFSANKGIVAPSVSVTDTNLELSGVVVEMEGYKNGATDYPATRSIIKNGQKVVYSDLPYEESADDMYTLHVTATDKAGRSVEENIVFSVNRFGSTYQFNKDTEKLLEKYYSNEEHEIIITETNVDTLQFKELYMLYNGEKVELTEGKNYRLEESGSDVTWKQYKYVLHKDNFENEGVYNIVVYSEDKAENESDNRIKNSEVEFVIDKTAPTVQISGLENDTQYISKERLVTIDVKDNMELNDMNIYLNNRKEAYESYSAEDVNNNGGIISLNLKNSNSRQNIVAVATDRAGNESQYEIKDFLITTNLFVQFYQNKPLFYGTIGVIAVIIAVVGYFIVFGKKKKSE